VEEKEEAKDDRQWRRKRTRSRIVVKRSRRRIRGAAKEEETC